MTDQQLSIDQALALAKKHAKNGQNATAKDIYERILEQQPDHPGARRGLKKLPRDAQDKNNFRQDMERLTALYEGGQDEEALVLATKLSRKYKTQPMPLNIRGAILTARKQLPDAIAAFEKAAELDPRYLDVWSNLGMAYQLNGQADAAMDCYRRIIGRNPRDANALYHMGVLYRTRGEVENSISAYERALEIAPGYVAAHCQLGISLKLMGEGQNALRSLRNAIDLDPGYVDAHREFGETLLQMKMYTASLEHLRTSVELDPNDPYCHYALATALLWTDQAEEAIPHFERSIALSDEPIASAVHFLKIARGETTDQPADGYVKALFDGYAKRFDKSLVDDLGYRGHIALNDLLKRTLGDRTFVEAIDLGCGTGLFGELVKDRVDRITGVDLSANMLLQAGERGIYDSLVEGDVVEALLAFEAHPDFVASTDVLVYMGSLYPLFTAVKDRASPGAIFAFTTEKLPDGDFKLLPTGRYAHSEEYVMQTAERHGLRVLANEEGQLRRELADWLTGGYYVLEVPAE